MASKKSFEDLDLSQEEIKRISEALKDEKFRKMFVEYAEEISNPENRKRYEEEIAMMEQERGMDVQFVHPHPGYVLKTVVDGDKKAFINICTNDKIGQPNAKKHTDSTGKNGLHWQIPHSFSPPREDFDKNKTTCMVYDVVYHPDTFRMTNNPRFKKMVEDTAIDGIERQFQCKLDRNNIKYPKLKYKGQPVATVIRSRKDDQPKSEAGEGDNNPLSGMPYPYSDKTSAELAEENCKNVEKQEKEIKNKASKTKSSLEKKEENGYTTPKYSIIHRGYLELQEFTNARDSKPTTRPKELVVSIELPLCTSAAGVELDIFEEKLVLKSEKPAYKLDLKLPYPVNDENGFAKFDKAKKSLVITLPVVSPKIPSFSGDSNADMEANTDQMQPLIEELPTTTQTPNQQEKDDELPPLAIDNNDKVVCEEHTAETITTQETVNAIAYNLPEYDYNQDRDSVTFIYHVRNVAEDSVSKSFPKAGVCLIRFMSLGSGGFPMHYGFYVNFGGVTIVPEHTMIDISERNMTVTLLKGRDCRFIWNNFSAGLDESSLEEKLFLTTDNLNSELDQLQLEGEKMGRTDLTEPIEEYQAPSVEVTEMNKKKLTIKITEPKTKFREDSDLDEAASTPSSASIQIVHSTSPPPELHGILKQRSISESSEDHFNGSTGDSSAGSSPRDGECPKHVTFNSRVDRTMFQTNAATKTIKTALKNKRKNERKREAKREKVRRRRHNSTGSEYSSCDDGDDVKLSSESHSEDDHEDLSEQMIATGNKVESSGVIEEEDEKTVDKSEQSHPDAHDQSKHGKRQSKKNRNKKNKLAEQVKSKMSEVKVEKCDSDDDVDDDCGVLDERTSKRLDVENVEKQVDRTSNGVKVSGDVVEDLSKIGDNDNQGGVKAAKGGELKNVGEIKDSGTVENEVIKGDDPIQGLDTVVAASDGAKSGKLDESTNGNVDAIKGDNQSNCDQKNVSIDNKEDGYHEKGDGKTEHKGNGDQPKSDVETELSWKEVDRNSAFNEHRTECAFKFSNEVMYDLDID